MVEYYFRNIEGAKIGPLDSKQFLQHRNDGAIEDRTMVWHSGMVDWEPYATILARDEAAKAPKPRPGRTPAAAPARSAVTSVDRQKCGTCHQEWPKTLLSMESGRPMCGNCERIKKEKERAGEKAAVLGGWAAWWMKFACGLVVIAALIAIRLHVMEGEKAELKAKLALKAGH